MEKSNQKNQNNRYGEFIKSMRGQMLLTQEELGKELGVGPITIMRWEQGISEPNFLNKKKLENFCELNGIDIAKYL